MKLNSMAEITTININDEDISIRDNTARASIDALEEAKQDKFSIGSDSTDFLDLTTNSDGELNLNFDASSIATKTQLNSINGNIKEVETNTETKINNLKSDIASVFNSIFGKDAVSDDLDVSADISNLDIPEIKTSISNNTELINNLSSTIDSKKEDTDTKITSLNETIENNNKSLATRINWIEKELFGYLYADNTSNSEDSVSRLDKIEAILKLVVGACLKRNVIQPTIDASIQAYNSDNAGSEINSTNYSYS